MNQIVTLGGMSLTYDTPPLIASYPLASVQFSDCCLLSNLKSASFNTQIIAQKISERFFHRIRNESEYKVAIFRLSANFNHGWGNPHIYGDDLKYEDYIKYDEDLKFKNDFEQKDNLKYEDDLNYEYKHNYEDTLKYEENLKNANNPILKTVPDQTYTTLVVLVFL